ncbi:MAG TPA: apolipoprotein N-acyltransferase, partial [Bryobacteraceae bacterium]|nr:apolipoprotein N-acyltransferase [Bryobacteraceae bacterium]
VAPLLIALAREWQPKHRFLLGFGCGLVSWGGVCYWIHFVATVHGGVGEAGGAAAFAVFCFLKAFHLGAFGLLAGVLIQNRFAILSIPALWVAIERIPGFFWFVWLTLGNAGVDMGVPMRLVPYTGVYGISFVFCMMATGIALILLRRPRIQILPVLLLPAMLLLPPLPPPTRGTESAVSLQPNLREDKEWYQNEVVSMQKRLEYLTLQSALDPRLPAPKLILWPEVPAPLYYYTDTGFRDGVTNMARLSRTRVLIGTVAHTQNNQPLNSALMLTPSGQVAGRYDKIWLVPFGEYVPTPFGFVNKISGEIGEFAAGEKIVLFDLGKEKLGAFICYESAFPHLVRRFAAGGAQVFANLSNDGYFGKSAARQQHLSLVRMRAAENRRWILRSTNDGLTAAVDPAGRITQILSPFQETAARLQFSLVADQTVYTRYGDWFAWTCVAAAALALLLSQIPKFG